MCPVGATLAIHHIRLPQRAVGTQLSRTAVDEGAVRKDDLIPIACCLPCREHASRFEQEPSMNCYLNNVLTIGHSPLRLNES